MNPFIGQPIQGTLRNGMAFMARRLKEPVEASTTALEAPHLFWWQGRDGEGQPQIWTEHGFWRGDGREHGFDIPNLKELAR